MKKNFLPSLKFTLAFEGGYVNHPRDPGGHTNKGITLSTLRRVWRPTATVDDLKNISDEMVAKIYYNDYWRKVNGDTLDAGVDGATFDYGVNSGPAAARKSLMAVIGGPAHETVKKLCARRLSIYRTFSHWNTFGRGWTRRIVAGEALWVKWALAQNLDDHVVKGVLEDEAAAAKKQAGNDAKKSAGSGAAGGAAGGGGVEYADQVAAYALGGMVIVALLAVAYFLWRNRINRAREEAYRKEAAVL